MPDLSSAASAILVFQGLLVLGGVGLLGAWFFAPQFAAIRHAPARMPVWNAPVWDSLLVIWAVLSSWFAGMLLASSVSAQFELKPTDGWASVLAVLGFQGSIVFALALLALYRRSAGRPLPPIGAAPASPVGDRLLLGAAVFCVAMPFVIGTSYLSTFTFELLGIPVKPQELANLFATTDSPSLLAALTLMGVVVAPAGEEVLFRAGLFRLLGSVMPHWAAVLLSALAFATLHWNVMHFVPLTVLGAIFAIAYKRTGSLLVPITAHALFNLNSIVGLLAGLGTSS